MSKTGVNRRGTIHDRKLMRDDNQCTRFTVNGNDNGLYIEGNKLYDNGSLVAVSAEDNPQLICKPRLQFGEVVIDTDNLVINITLENYNKLYKRQEVAGYKYFNPRDIYRIVDNVATAPIITYTRSNGKLIFGGGIEFPEIDYLLYNNIVGDSVIYEEDLENTVMMYNCPHLCVRYFNPRIQLGDSIKIPIAIDDYFASYISGRTVTGPYTIEVRNEDNNATLVRKTVYAGETIVETMPFNAIGESWFTVRCIDSNGVSSPVHYLDVLVEDPNYEDNFLVASDADLADFGIVPDDDDMVVAYLNKKGLSDIFAYAVNNGYNGIKLPLHTYYICDYKNKSNVSNVIELRNDAATYCMCEIENVLDDSDNIVGNRVTKKVDLTEEQVMADSEGLFVTGIFRTYNNQNIDEISVGSEDVRNSGGNLYAEGSYYFVKRSDPETGDYVVFPSNFTVDLNGSTIEIVKQYDFKNTRSITIQRNTDTHIKNGKLKAGLETYNWKRVITRQCYYMNSDTAYPMEQAIPISFEGNRFCSLENIIIEGAIGYTIATEVDISTYTRALNNSFTPLGYNSVNIDYGLYDNKRLSLITGMIEDCYSDRQTFVHSDTSKPYNNDGDNADNEIGYIYLADRPDNKYVFVGYGQNFVTNKGKRQEVFVFFYDENNTLIKTVKTRKTWMVRIPNGAVKLRVMGYGHSTKISSDKSNWTYMGVSQVRNAVGMVYKNCTVQKVRSAIVCGDERQVLYDNINFNNVANQSIINPDGIEHLNAITYFCVDLESGAAFGKYITFKNCTTETPGVTGFCIQGGENIQFENCELKLDDWGLWSGLMKGNEFFAYGAENKSRCINAVRRDTFLFHRHVQWDGNVVQPRESGEPPQTANSILITVNALTFPESVFDDTRDTTFPMRKSNITKKSYDYYQVTDTLLKLQNSKYADLYID